MPKREDVSWLGPFTGPEYRTPIAPDIEVRKHGVFVYRCATCGNELRYDDAYGPACTGPSPSLDEHPLEPMYLDRVDEDKSTIIVLGPELRLGS